MYFDDELDTSGLLCPVPLLKTKQRLKALEVGKILRVISTDPSSPLDFKVFTETSGHTLLANYQANNLYYFLIQKSVA